MVTLERTQAVPLSMRDDGTIHVAGSRVTLDMIIGRHKRGDTPEEIHDGFPTLTLAQIYGVLHYYHQHAEQVDEYLARRKAEAIATQNGGCPWNRQGACAVACPTRGDDHRH